MHKKYWGFGLWFLSAVCVADPAADVSLTRQFGGQNPWSLDFWWPLGNDSNNRFYTDTGGSVSTAHGNFSTEFGLVHRQQIATWGWGQYGYVQYNYTLNSQSFFTLNPGLEWMNDRWHTNWNFYIPISTTRRSLAPQTWASSVGIDNYANFQPHAILDQRLQLSETTGPGVDFITSYHFAALNNSAVFAGPYYFHLFNAPINTSPTILGISAGLESPEWHRFSGKLAYSYDNLNRNTVSIGLSVNLGPPLKAGPFDWFNQPVQHNIATLGQANTVPIVEGYVPMGQSLMADNVWFLTPGSTSLSTTPTSLADCTYANPCSGLDNNITQAIGTLAPTGNFQDQPTLYLAPGTYTPPPNEVLFLYNNESLVGRSAGYLTDATGSSRPLIQTPEIVISGSNNNQNNTLANLQLNNTGILGNYAINIFSTNTTSIQNVLIGAPAEDNTPSVHYLWGVSANNVQQLTISNSTIYTDDTLSNSFYSTSLGIILEPGVQTLTLNNDQITTTTVTNNNTGSANLFLQGNTTVNINDSALIGLSANTNGALGGNANIQNMVNANNIVNINNSTLKLVGLNTDAQNANILMGNASEINLQNSQLFVSLDNSSNSAAVSNLYLLNNTSATLTNTTLVSNTTSTGVTAPANIFLNNNSSVIVNKSTLTSTGTTSVVTGSTNITAADNSSAVVQNSVLTTTFSGGPAASGQEPSGAVSLWALNNGKITVDNSQITAISGNDSTGAVALELENSAQGTITNSVLTSNQNEGSLHTNVGAATVVVGNSSQLIIKHSTINTNQNGTSNQTLESVLGLGTSVINISNTDINVNNAATLTDPTLLTMGVSAYVDSVITLDQVNLSVDGPNATPTHTEQNGQIIVKP